MARQLPLPGKPIPRFPYVWVTWLAGLLAGDKQCWFAAWMKAHHQLAKRPDQTFDRAAWAADHDRLVDLRAVQLMADGYTVHRERENEFKLVGKTALLSGKCDIIAFKGDHILFSDGKTGQEKKADFWQVLIYMRVMPLVRAGFGMGCHVDGEVVYGGLDANEVPVIRSILPVTKDDLTPVRTAQIDEGMRALAGIAVPRATPSGSECEFCDITSEDCPYRVEVAVADTTIF